MSFDFYGLLIHIQDIDYTNLSTNVNISKMPNCCGDYTKK